MRNYTQFVISLPLLVAPLIFVGTGQANAAAQNIGPTGAVKLLAQSRSADAKCKHLTNKEHAELDDYVAKAEIAAATMESAQEAKSARKSGNVAGKTMACGNSSEELVRATLDAARRAMAAARRDNKRKRVARKRAAAPTVRAQPRLVSVGSASSLTRYRRVTEAYYLERRCQHLSRPKAVRFWKKIVASHNAVLRKYTTMQVSKAKSGAERAARGWGSCGSRTAKIVLAGYRG